MKAFSTTILDCNANGNYVGSPSNPLIFPPEKTEKKQSGLHTDEPLFMNTKHIFFDDLLDTQSGSQLPCICAFLQFHREI